MLPSSPGAVQVRVMELDVGLVVVKFGTVAGGVLSVMTMVVKFHTLDHPELPEPLVALTRQ